MTEEVEYRCRSLELGGSVSLEHQRCCHRTGVGGFEDCSRLWFPSRNHPTFPNVSDYKDTWYLVKHGVSWSPTLHLDLSNPDL